MPILQILQRLIGKEAHDFIQELYWQCLNRSPGHMEVNQNLLLLKQGIPKISLIKNLMKSTEAIQLYEKPILVASDCQETITHLIREFYMKDIPSFMKRVDQEILGNQNRKLDQKWAQTLLLGIRSRISYIENTIDCSPLYKKGVLAKNSLILPPQFKENYPYTHQWIEEEQQYENVQFFYQDETIYIPPAKGLDPSVNQFLTINKNLSRPFVAILPNGQFSGSNGGMVITSQGKILSDLSQGVPNAAILVGKSPNFGIESGENIAVLHAFLGFNYFHWVFDVAARIDLLKQANIQIDKYITDSTLPFQDEILTLLGIPPEKRIQVHSNLHVKARNLIIPSYLESHLGIVPKWACDFLRKEFLQRNEIDRCEGPKRIYISRGNAHSRKVENEEEVVDALSSLGFQKVTLETEPVSRKIQLFISAEVIIAPHGAGLTHLFNCNPGTKVIELFNPNWVFPCYRVISHYMELDYYCLTGQGKHFAYRLDVRRNPDPIRVDRHRLFQTLEMATV